MKQCKTCGETKSLDDFRKLARSLDGYASCCKVCASTQSKLSYSNDSVNRIAKSKAHSQNLHKHNTAYVLEYLFSHPCVDCGETDILVLDFDHINDNKLYNVGFMLPRHTLTKLKAEIAKCEVRCRNCHKKITKARRTN